MITAGVCCMSYYSNFPHGNYIKFLVLVTVFVIPLTRVYIVLLLDSQMQTIEYNWI